MDNNPWEFLDIDVLDLQSFVRSSNPNLSSSSSTTLILGLVNVDDPLHATPLGSIDYTFDHVPLTVIIVKTGTPNSFGDMKVTLKIVKFNSDPTGTIVVTLWRTIIQDKDFGRYIAIGFVLTVMFCPFPPHSKCYLNIILQNVVKAMFLNFRLPIILVFTNLHPMLICC
ncbi:hypothetical protein GmHk_20G057595 [Glycine max]|nr:hypothetical protein GmHk_20G057595 [Glycine max]